MKKKLCPSRPKTVLLTTYSKNGLTSYHLKMDNRLWGIAMHGGPAAIQVIIALSAFTRTLRREFAGVKADK